MIVLRIIVKSKVEESKYYTNIDDIMNLIYISIFCYLKSCDKKIYVL